VNNPTDDEDYAFTFTLDTRSRVIVDVRDNDGEAAIDNLGRAVTGGRDFDGDGHPDIAYSAPFADPQGVSLGGEVEVVRIRPVLTASAGEVGAAAGGVVVFTMDFPLSEVGLPYLLLASRSGVGPTPYRGASIPLTNDSLFQLMVSSPPLVFSGAAGNLGPGGSAVATLTLTPGIAAGFVGSTVHFAALSLDLGSLPSVVSNVVALAILP
ncbi:MAG: integrin alpha, partial [Planctomycetota bacterium]